MAAGWRGRSLPRLLTAAAWACGLACGLTLARALWSFAPAGPAAGALEAGRLCGPRVLGADSGHPRPHWPATAASRAGARPAALAAFGVLALAGLARGGLARRRARGGEESWCNSSQSRDPKTKGHREMDWLNEMGHTGAQAQPAPAEGLRSELAWEELERARSLAWQWHEQKAQTELAWLEQERLRAAAWQWHEQETWEQSQLPGRAATPARAGEAAARRQAGPETVRELLLQARPPRGSTGAAAAARPTPLPVAEKPEPLPAAVGGAEEALAETPRGQPAGAAEAPAPTAQAPALALRLTAPALPKVAASQPQPWPAPEAEASGPPPAPPAAAAAVGARPSGLRELLTADQRGNAGLRELLLADRRGARAAPAPAARQGDELAWVEQERRPSLARQWHEQKAQQESRLPGQHAAPAPTESLAPPAPAPAPARQLQVPAVSEVVADRPQPTPAPEASAQPPRPRTRASAGLPALLLAERRGPAPAAAASAAGPRAGLPPAGPAPRGLPRGGATPGGARADAAPPEAEAPRLAARAALAPAEGELSPPQRHTREAAPAATPAVRRPAGAALGSPEPEVAGSPAGAVAEGVRGLLLGERGLGTAASAARAAAADDPWREHGAVQALHRTASGIVDLAGRAAAEVHQRAECAELEAERLHRQAHVGFRDGMGQLEQGARDFQEAHAALAGQALDRVARHLHDVQQAHAALASQALDHVARHLHDVPPARASLHGAMAAPQHVAVAAQRIVDMHAVGVEVALQAAHAVAALPAQLPAAYEGRRAARRAELRAEAEARAAEQQRASVYLQAAAAAAAPGAEDGSQRAARLLLENWLRERGPHQAPP